MALTKQIITDKIESVRVQDHYVLQCREAIQVLEDGKILSQSFNRYSLNPDDDIKTDENGETDLSKITDPKVKAQFEAIMTDEVKDNYAKFLKEQEKASE